MNYHRAFGLTLASNQLIEQLPEIPAIENPDVEVNWVGDNPSDLMPGHQPVFETRNQDGSISINFWRLDADDFLLRFEAPKVNLEYLIEDHGERVKASWNGIQDLRHLLPPFNGPVLGILLRIRNKVCLHASAVEFEQGVVALVGDKGAGKSTTAAALIKKGGKLVSDDITAIDFVNGNFVVHPGTTGLRLWADSAFALHGLSYLRYPRLYGKGKNRPNKRLKSLTGRQITPPDQLPKIQAAYFLEASNTESKSLYIESTNSAESLAILSQNTYCDYAVSRSGKAKEFGFLARLVESIPCRRVGRPENLSSIRNLSDSIYTDFMNVVRTPTGCL